MERDMDMNTDRDADRDMDRDNNTDSVLNYCSEHFLNEEKLVIYFSLEYCFKSERVSGQCHSKKSTKDIDILTY
jgi:hypothetical protein